MQRTDEVFEAAQSEGQRDTNSVITDIIVHIVVLSNINLNLKLIGAVFLKSM